MDVAKKAGGTVVTGGHVAHSVDNPEPVNSEALERLMQALDAELARLGKNLDGVDIRSLAKSVARTIPKQPDAHPILEKVGPFYDTPGVREWLGLSRQVLLKRVRAHKMLACKTDDNHLLYPVWQFQDDGTIIPGLEEVLPILASGVDAPWTWGLWLTARVPEELDGKSAVEWLSEGRSPEPVKALAREDAASWAA